MAQTQRTRPEAQHSSHSVQRHAEKEEKHNSIKSVTAPNSSAACPALSAASQKGRKKTVASAICNPKAKLKGASGLRGLRYCTRRAPMLEAVRHCWQAPLATCQTGGAVRIPARDCALFSFAAVGGAAFVRIKGRWSKIDL
ncbi:hypothetical protein HPB50_019863 [Hyalomma asiaticum]|uniref:Uncharacterized protein n=1 Tax=Hyalomma asiaticum TaxID=266040 RepID=A0ACB7SWJ1_HYAAI|nr:hypothetical protein HPB50_019863 [Hyalomma asiaticum]